MSEVPRQGQAAALAGLALAPIRQKIYSEFAFVQPAMDEHTLTILLTIFIGLAALAMLVQAGALLGVFLVARKLQKNVTPLIPQVEGVVGVTRQTIERV